MVVWQENITPGRFEGQAVIVTGAASGIGRASAVRVAREGGRVIATDMSGEGLDKLVADYAELGFVYTVSKHALIGLTRSSAVMYGRRGIRVNAVAPGGTRTNIHAEFKSQLGAEVLGPLLQANVPPIAEAGEVAAGITFLLSRDGSNINGVVLPSDNGWNAV
ncbi:SDR family oxidoreductase [Arthrobacter sp. OY3WO11]|uniref:SDR family NAD(P)-dependent oxidoreductase n=1 Tax=Arthrobacter sp. OY3WO11 TaxID=1835723 RepID=UPI0007CFE4C8|nr:SDR family oxidoreductase [Arthrobacter sp. OY3WO11]OAE02030.1 hypothetical protein A6A22_11770 [Arthrobacter sp. OY3WO11]